jgi:uncharacterized RDD family membrane protein YckC
MKKKRPKKYSLTIPKNFVRTKSAPIIRRAGSYLIDLLIFYFIMFQPLAILTLSYSGMSVDTLTACSKQEVLNSFCEKVVVYSTMIFSAALFILFLYLVMFEKFVGSTIGEKILGLRVIGDTRFRSMILRNLTKSILIILLPIDMIGIAIKKDGQRFTEKISKTKLIYEEKEYDVIRSLLERG